MTRRTAAETQKKMLADNVYALAADPTKPHANPTPLQDGAEIRFRAAGSGGGDT